MDDVTLSSSSSSEVLLTPEGFEALQKELEHLTVVKRPEIANRLRDSKQHGEFSEDNNELDEVKFEQAMVENRIAELKTIFSNARTIDKKTTRSNDVGIGSFVKLQSPDNKVEFEIRIVSSIEADPDRDLVSVESPLGMALLGKKVGDEVQFDAPAGRLKYKVAGLRT